MNTKIKELPKNERPRERLINKGASSLSDEELLSIVLKTGTKDASAKVVAAQILKNIGSIQNLKNIDLHELLKIKGIGTAKACLILAISELCKRLNIKQEKINGEKITHPIIVYNYYKDIINERQEYFYCLYLDSNKKVLKEKLLFMGTVNQSLVHPRDIFKEAYQVNAVAFICVHNHPNGEAKPSKEDIAVTNRLKEIGKLMGIKLVDHVIVCQDEYYSFLENGQI